MSTVTERAKIRYTELCEINTPQAEEFKKRGWCVFTECDSDGTYFYKGYGWVNRIGYLVFEDNIDMDYFEYSDLKQIGIYDDKFNDDVYQVVQEHQDINYHYHIKGKLLDHYELIRTYSDEEAKRILGIRMKYMKEIDPTIRAYRFGKSHNPKQFWKIEHSIKENYLTLIHSETEG